MPNVSNGAAVVASIAAFVLSIAAMNKTVPVPVCKAGDQIAQVAAAGVKADSALAVANRATQLAEGLRAELLRDKITSYLMDRKVRDMKDEELVLLLRTERYEEAADELGKRRVAALKAAGQKAQPKKK